MAYPTIVLKKKKNHSTCGKGHMWMKTYAYTPAQKRAKCRYMEKIEKCLKKIRRWEEELAYAHPARAATLTMKIARLKTRL